MSERDTRNPWIILGVDYGCDSSAASEAFARKAKALRKMEEPRWDRTDLAWALSEIQSLEGDPLTKVDHYRVPADAGAYDLLASETPGLLAPLPPSVVRLTAPTSELDVGVLADRVLRSFVERILQPQHSQPAPCPYAVDGEHR